MAKYRLLVGKHISSVPVCTPQELQALAKKSVQELTAFAAEKGVDLLGLKEKGEILNRIRHGREVVYQAGDVIECEQNLLDYNGRGGQAPKFALANTPNVEQWDKSKETLEQFTDRMKSEPVGSR